MNFCRTFPKFSSGQTSSLLNLFSVITNTNDFRRQIEKSSQPTRYVQQMEKAEVKFKPIAVHAEMV